MSTLYLDKKGTELRTRGDALIFYSDGEKRGSLPLKMLERIVIRAHTDLDSSVLLKLAEKGIGVTLLSTRQGRFGAALLGRPHNDVTRRLIQYEWYRDKRRRARWSAELVHAKIANQKRLLERALQDRPDQRRPLFKAISALQESLLKLQASPDLLLESLRGIEGAAAAAYYAGFTSIFAGSLNFTGRNRRPPKDPVNACLSLGYTLLHGELVSACFSAGLDPLLGFYHEPAYGRESLATDLIEPLRPHLDEWVWQRFRNRDLRVEDFNHDKGACLLNKQGRRDYYAAYETFAKPVRRLIRRQVRKLVKALEADTHSFSIP